ncbi:hypothetical protein [Gloeocapsopsis dulcis]|uniref:hypothetical protein n=1 Tax=Gloeocapsopsis dulcis TaxID=2859516 RepID=UPI00101AE7CB|nr:hypothetical protein [Gloeocapsopsis dulcis]WNN88308.1 hypothetical protein P0S91_18720 [Gloeocapsopsis dulcis]
MLVWLDLAIHMPAHTLPITLRQCDRLSRVGWIEFAKPNIHLHPLQRMFRCNVNGREGQRLHPVGCNRLGLNGLQGIECKRGVCWVYCRQPNLRGGRSHYGRSESTLITIA